MAAGCAAATAGIANINVINERVLSVTFMSCSSLGKRDQHGALMWARDGTTPTVSLSPLLEREVDDVAGPIVEAQRQAAARSGPVPIRLRRPRIAINLRFVDQAPS